MLHKMLKQSSLFTISPINENNSLQSDITLTINCIKTYLEKKDHTTEVIHFTKTYLAKDDNETLYWH